MAVITQSAFTTSWWLRNRHIQTILPLAHRTRHNISYRKHRLELSDGDFVDIFWCDPGKQLTALTESPSTPVVIVAHGMGGCFESHYVPGMITSLLAQGYRVAFLHARGCSGEPNRLPITFHAADTSEVDQLVGYIKMHYPQAPLAAVGFSLGGSVLLKWLAEAGNQALLSAAVALSVPFELAATAETINRGFALVYQEYLLRRLKALAIEKSHLHPAPLTVRQIRGVRTLRDYDDRMTAKINGFGNVDNYYRIASCRQYLSRISTPTLILQAIDDPFVPRYSLPREQELGSSVIMELADHGGHVGFLQNTFQDKRYFNERIPQFLSNYLTAQ